MSDPDSASLTLTTRADEITTPPEKMSLVYEELFDDESSDGTPCYLPDRPQNGLLTSPNGSGVPEIDYVDKEGAPDSQSNDEQDGSSEPPDCDSETEQLQKKAESIEYDDIAEANDGTKHDTDKINQDEFEETVALEGSSHKSLDKPERGVGTVQIQQDGSPHAEMAPCRLDDVGEQAVGSRFTNAGRVEDTITEVGPADDGSTSTKGEMDVPIKNFIHEKQHEDEDDTSASWRKHKKHFFILSHAGKPIYSRYGDEHKLAGFSATLQAIISFVENSGDCIRFIRARDHQIVFLVKGPIYLVSVSATDEPVWALRGQLELLHGQLLLILTKGLERCFVKNSNFDLRPLLGGTEIVFASLIRSFSWNPASFLHSYTCLQLPHTARQAAGAALQDVADTDLLFALLLAGSKVISLIGTQKSSLHPDDILLLSNFVASSESFRTTESFSPVCLPNYNAMAFLYAYIHYLDADTCLILITSNSDAFFHLKECRVKIETFLREAHVLSDIAHSVQNGGLRVEDLPGDVLHGSGQFTNRTCEPDMGSKERAGVGGAGGLWHFIYRSVYLDQYAASKFSPPLHTRKSQKQLLRAYERLHASMHGGSGGSRQMQYQRDETHVLLAWSTTDFEFFAAFDPLAEKSTAITVCNRVCQWIRDVESDIFFLGANIFNW